MVALFEETEPLIPRIAFYALIIILATTDVFILICTQIEAVGTPMWMFTVSTIIFAAIVLGSYFIRMKIIVSEDKITVRLVKKYVIPFTDIIDHKTGDIDIIRNYSGWGFKNVKFKNLICNGYERGITLKLLGKRVFTISTSDPEGFAALLPVPEPT